MPPGNNPIAVNKNNNNNIIIYTSLFAVGLNPLMNLYTIQCVDGSRFNLINDTCRIHYIPSSRRSFPNNIS